MDSYPGTLLSMDAQEIRLEEPKSLWLDNGQELDIGRTIRATVTEGLVNTRVTCEYNTGAIRKSGMIEGEENDREIYTWLMNGGDRVEPMMTSIGRTIASGSPVMEYGDEKYWPVDTKPAIWKGWARNAPSGSLTRHMILMLPEITTDFGGTEGWYHCAMHGKSIRNVNLRKEWRQKGLMGGIGLSVQHHAVISRVPGKFMMSGQHVKLQPLTHCFIAAGPLSGKTTFAKKYGYPFFDIDWIEMRTLVNGEWKDADLPYEKDWTEHNRIRDAIIIDALRTHIPRIVLCHTVDDPARWGYTNGALEVYIPEPEFQQRLKDAEPHRAKMALLNRAEFGNPKAYPSIDRAARQFFEQIKTTGLINMETFGAFADTSYQSYASADATHAAALYTLSNTVNDRDAWRYSKAQYYSMPLVSVPRYSDHTYTLTELRRPNMFWGFEIAYRHRNAFFRHWSVPQSCDINLDHVFYTNKPWWVGRDSWYRLWHTTNHWVKIGSWAIRHTFKLSKSESIEWRMSVLRSIFPTVEPGQGVLAFVSEGKGFAPMDISGHIIDWLALSYVMWPRNLTHIMASAKAKDYEGQEHAYHTKAEVVAGFIVARRFLKVVGHEKWLYDYIRVREPTNLFPVALRSEVKQRAQPHEIGRISAAVFAAYWTPTVVADIPYHPGYTWEKTHAFHKRSDAVIRTTFADVEFLQRIPRGSSVFYHGRETSHLPQMVERFGVSFKVAGRCEASPGVEVVKGWNLHDMSGGYVIWDAPMMENQKVYIFEGRSSPFAASPEMMEYIYGSDIRSVTLVDGSWNLDLADLHRDIIVKYNHVRHIGLHAKFDVPGQRAATQLGTYEGYIIFEQVGLLAEETIQSYWGHQPWQTDVISPKIDHGQLNIEEENINQHNLRATRLLVNCKKASVIFRPAQFTKMTTVLSGRLLLLPHSPDASRETRILYDGNGLETHDTKWYEDRLDIHNAWRRVCVSRWDHLQVKSQ